MNPLDYLKTLKIGDRIAAVAILAVLIMVVLAYHFWSAAATDKAVADLAATQANAAMASGADAANTISNGADRDAATDATTRENDHAIQSTAGASVIVAKPINDAGLRSLCKRAAYRGNARCLQFANPK